MTSNENHSRDQTPAPSGAPRSGRLFWLVGLTIGILSGAAVAIQLTNLG